MREADAGDTTAHPAAHGWRRLVLAARIMARSLGVATGLIPPDPDGAAAVGDRSAR